jgi:anti-anti-sigma regulatory factor
MDLKITNYNNFFKVTGILNRQSVHVFQNAFQDIFEKVSQLTISLEDLESIDSFGVAALAKLHNESLLKNKQVAIIGFGCQDLYQHFKSNDAA